MLNDLERIGDHAENFHEIGLQMQEEGLSFSEVAREEISQMQKKVACMFELALDAFDHSKTERLDELTALENEVDKMKKELSARHFARLSEGSCQVELSAYFYSTVSGLERVADHLINVGYSILNPTGSQSQAREEAKA